MLLRTHILKIMEALYEIEHCDCEYAVFLHPQPAFRYKVNQTWACNLHRLILHRLIIFEAQI